MRKAFANFSYSNRFQGVVAGAVILNTACAAEDPDKAQPIPDPTSTMPTDLVIYSPAPPRIMLHAHNV